MKKTIFLALIGIIAAIGFRSDAGENKADSEWNTVQLSADEWKKIKSDIDKTGTSLLFRRRIAITVTNAVSVVQHFFPYGGNVDEKKRENGRIWPAKIEPRPYWMQ